jgi:hypothetical protein
MSYESPKYCIGDLYAGITMNVKKSMILMGPICGYCIFENGLMEFIIKNDVGIACLECGYCFKNL